MNAPDAHMPEPTSAHEAWEESLNLYVDGELSFADQAALFAHLASCDECRRTLDAVLKFRRMSRQEHLSVPPALDDVVLQRLAQSRELNARIDRAADRRPLWQSRTDVSVRALVLAALMVFCLGALMPREGNPEESLPVIVQAEDELVELPALDRVRSDVAAAIYVFYPGLTIEATKSEELTSPESL